MGYVADTWSLSAASSALPTTSSMSSARWRQCSRTSFSVQMVIAISERVLGGNRRAGADVGGDRLARRAAGLGVLLTTLSGEGGFLGLGVADLEAQDVLRDRQPHAAGADVGLEVERSLDHVAAPELAALGVDGVAPREAHALGSGCVLGGEAVVAADEERDDGARGGWDHLGVIALTDQHQGVGALHQQHGEDVLRLLPDHAVVLGRGAPAALRPIDVLGGLVVVVDDHADPLLALLLEHEQRVAGTADGARAEVVVERVEIVKAHDGFLSGCWFGVPLRRLGGRRRARSVHRWRRRR